MTGRYVILISRPGLVVPGFHLSITSLAMQPAAMDFAASDRRTGHCAIQCTESTSSKKGSSGVRSAHASQHAGQLKHWKSLVTGWFAWYQCEFLFGAATGGLLFGRLGDRWGRSKAMWARVS